MAAGSSEPLAKPSAARVTQGRNRLSRRRDSAGARLTPPRSPSAPHQFFIPMQIDGCGAGSSVLSGPSSLCSRGQTRTALGCSDVDPSTAQTAQHAQSDLPSLLRGESASWANGRIRSLSQSCDGGCGPVAFPLDPLPPGRYISGPADLGQKLDYSTVVF